ncbi:HTH-type transcriptional activator RhaS [Sporomusa silvacetica DSM 10669]|uniref:HTH-type transcriptional activator RhaS n=1 Tax=Sporomusa silvacetica DSM 10669 TaxID=1123289 RepID=A0ABZ3IGT4_9FIRM|nr:response regulator [Sporomusa silvacetica]OZC16467.1 putative response regulatory protein [Sporomusa silvacetica DSM 10669]
MYKMIIADDEPAVRQYLRYIVKQYNLPFQICGEAEDGEQAVQLADLYQPEFIILDINMPLMNGLEAAKIIRERHKEAIIYILTAYSQFEYAHQAVQTHVADYLLKPIKPAQLADTLRKGIASALSQRIAKQRLQRLEQQIAKDRPVVTQQRLFELLKSDSDNSSALKLLQSISKKEDFSPAAVLSVSYWQNSDRLQSVGMEERLLQESTALFGEHTIVTSFSDELVMIFDHWDYEVRCVLQTQLEEWERKYAITICAGLSLVVSPSRIGRDYKNAKKKREAGLFWHQQGLLVIDGAVDGPQEIECEDVQKQLRECLLERKSDKAKEIFHQFLSEAKQCVCQPEYVYAAIIKIANNLIEKYAEYIISDNDAILIRKNFISQVNQTVSVCDLEQCLCNLIDTLTSNVGSLEQNQAEQAVKWAVEYINSNYNKELTLEQLAEKLFISTGYFCRIFKKHAGEGYATYLTNIRLKKAKEILLTGNYTVNEVARMVGFRDASYFSSVFKKHYHQSPSNLAASIRVGS